MTATSIFLSGSFVNSPPRNGITSGLAGCIRKALADYRARRTKMQTIRYLRSLDSATLDDIGVDVHALRAPFARIVRANTYVIGIATFSLTRGSCL